MAGREEEIADRHIRARQLEALVAIELRLGEQAVLLREIKAELLRHGDVEKEQAGVVERLEKQQTAQDAEVARLNAEKLAGKSNILTFLSDKRSIAAILAILLAIAQYFGFVGG